MAKNMEDPGSSTLDSRQAFLVSVSVRTLCFWFFGLILASYIHNHQPGYRFSETVFTPRSFFLLAVGSLVTVLEVWTEQKFPVSTTKWWLRFLVGTPFSVAFFLSVLYIL
jgi:uncharacterized protein (DUF983 family)